MTEQDNDRYLTADQAAEILGTSPRSIHRYGESGQLRTRKTGRRVMYHEGDVHRMARDLQVQRRGPDPDEVGHLRDMLTQATYRIGYLEAQLERRLLPDHEMQMRDELASLRVERDELRRRVEQAERQGARQGQVLLVLVIVAAVLVTVLVIVLLRPSF